MLMEQYGRHDYEFDDMEFTVQVIEPIAGGKHNYPILNAHYSRSVIQIRTNPNETNCLARAIAVGISR